MASDGRTGSIPVPSTDMRFDNRYSASDEFRRDELVGKIEKSLKNLTLAELEALYYQISTQTYTNDDQS